MISTYAYDVRQLDCIVYLLEQRQSPVKGELDVLVTGAGVARIAVALAARRESLTVLLLE